MGCALGLTEFISGTAKLLKPCHIATTLMEYVGAIPRIEFTARRCTAGSPTEGTWDKPGGTPLGEQYTGLISQSFVSFYFRLCGTGLYRFDIFCQATLGACKHLGGWRV